jgi:hypothetical protein
MQSYAADDFDEINKRLIEIRRITRVHREHICAIRNGVQSKDCWCYLMGEGGVSLPCSDASDHMLY